jgi:hypothetical protein
MFKKEPEKRRRGESEKEKPYVSLRFSDSPVPDSSSGGSPIPFFETRFPGSCLLICVSSPVRLGLHLKVPKGHKTRPTADQVREAILIS